MTIFHVNKLNKNLGTEASYKILSDCIKTERAILPKKQLFFSFMHFFENTDIIIDIIKY